MGNDNAREPMNELQRKDDLGGFLAIMFRPGNTDTVELLRAAAEKPVPDFHFGDFASWDPIVEEAFQATQTPKREAVMALGALIYVPFGLILHSQMSTATPVSRLTNQTSNMAIICGVVLSRLLYWFLLRGRLQATKWHHTFTYGVVVCNYTLICIRSLVLVQKIVHYDGPTDSHTNWTESVMGFGQLLICPCLLGYVGLPMWMPMVLAVAGSATLSTSPFVDVTLQIVMAFALLQSTLISQFMIYETRKAFVQKLKLLRHANRQKCDVDVEHSVGHEAQGQDPQIGFSFRFGREEDGVTQSSKTAYSNHRKAHANARANARAKTNQKEPGLPPLEQHKQDGMDLPRPFHECAAKIAIGIFICSVCYICPTCSL